MNCFFDYNAKYQKALRCRNAILDQGYFQNIISLFEKPLTLKILRRYLNLILLPDKLFILNISPEEIKKRMIKKETNLPRSQFGYTYVKKWFSLIKKNDKFFKKNLRMVSINYLIISNQKDIPL